MYERDAINAVMGEWFKTLTSLPAAIRMAVEMGIVSSSQLVRFMSVDVRPSVVRAVSRARPLPSLALSWAASRRIRVFGQARV